jgi:hypothetical protein
MGGDERRGGGRRGAWEDLEGQRHSAEWVYDDEEIQAYRCENDLAGATRTAPEESNGRNAIG